MKSLLRSAIIAAALTQSIPAAQAQLDIARQVDALFEPLFVPDSPAQVERSSQQEALARDRASSRSVNRRAGSRGDADSRERPNRRSQPDGVALRPANSSGNRARGRQRAQDRAAEGRAVAYQEDQRTVEEIAPPRGTVTGDNRQHEPPIDYGLSWDRGMRPIGEGDCMSPDCSPMACPPCDYCEQECCVCPRRCLTFSVEYLLLRPSNADVAYASEVDGPDNADPPQGIQVGPMGVVGPGYRSGYRAGFTVPFGMCARIGASFTDFTGGDNDTVTRADNATTVIRPLVTHPLAENAASDWDTATAEQAVRLRMLDVDYILDLQPSCQHEMALFVGPRFGQLKQRFRSEFAGLGFRNVGTDIDFDGGGVGLGLDLKRLSACRRWVIYGRGEASFLVGDFNGRYEQISDADPNEVFTTWSAARIVPVLNLGVGIGWRGPCDRLRFDAGYRVGAWYNVVPTDGFITAVHANDFDSVSDDILFDGVHAALTLRL